MIHSIALASPSRFAGWPAKNGMLSWVDDEVLTGCVSGRFASQPGHNLAQPYTHHLLRSQDGGATWQVETPAHYVVADEPDLGYPQLAQLSSGELLAVYYWASRDHPQQHIAVTRWQP